MTVNVPFLQRLAPAFRDGTHAARPVLGPRFAPAEALAPAPSRPAVPAAPPLGARTHAGPLVPEQQLDGTPPQAIPAPRNDRPDDTTPLRPTAVRPALRPGVAETLPAAVHRPAVALPTGRVDAAVPPVVRPSVPTAASPAKAAPPDLTAQHVPAALPVPETPAPTGLLSPATLAQRMPAPPPPAAPVIHVTIDRLDVRLPTPAPAPAAVIAPRRAAATLPLADYLRQRRGGGPR
jgi:hypothetical protein